MRVTPHLDSDQCFVPGSGAQHTAAQGVAECIATSTRGSTKRDESRRRVVRFKGVPIASDEPANERPNSATRAGDVRLLRGYHATQMHELNSVIALRNAKALAMSLGLPCRFAWPVLWCKDCAVICSAHPEGPHKDYIGRAILPRMSPRSDAIKELFTNWEKLDHFGMVQT